MNYEAEQRDIGKETRDTLQAQIDLAPDQYRVESQYAPLYSALRQRSLETMLTGNNTGKSYLDMYSQDLMPAMTRAQSASNTASREADLGDLNRYGASAVAAIKAANPQQAALEDSINGAVMKMVGQGGASGLEDRETTQAIRSAQAARGLGYGQGDTLSELLALDRLRQSRQQSRLGTAMQWAGQQYGMTADPTMVLLGRTSNAAGASATATGQNQSQIGQRTEQFNPFNGYASDLYSSNQNAKSAANSANSNFTGGVLGGLFSLGGSLGGGYLAGR